MNLFKPGAKTPDDTTTTEIERVQLWQRFRVRCLELAIQSGATPETAIEVAEKFGRYILARSDLELHTAEAGTDEEDE